MNITVVGTGYVGLVSGVCMSQFGFTVHCVDNNAEKIAALQQFQIPIYEPGLEEIARKNGAAGRLIFTTDLASSVAQSDIVFIAVGTPPDEHGRSDLTQLEQVMRALAPHLRDGATLVIKSTVPVGTSRRMAKLLAQANQGLDFDIACNPEFLREGSAVKDFMAPDRIIIGLDSKRALERITRLYDPLRQNSVPLVFTTLESAEMIKYAANTMLALRIGFINEMADVCERVGANVRDVAFGIGLDKRIGPQFLKPGPGYGGSCLPKDTQALAHFARDAGAPTKLVEALIESNEVRKIRMAHRVLRAVGGSVSGKTIAVLGLAFKPETDDMRDSPSLTVLPELEKKGAKLRVFDPQSMNESKKLMPDLNYCTDAYDAMTGADCVLLLTEWNEFRHLDFARAKTLMRAPVMVDLRNLYKRSQMIEAGFEYHSIGRQPVQSDTPYIPDLNPADDLAA